MAHFSGIGSFLSMCSLVKVSVKNWSTFHLQKTKAPGLESLVRHLDLVRRQRRQLIAWSRAHLIGRLTTRLFFKWRVLLRHRKTSRVVTLFFFPLITNGLARS